MFHYSSRPDSLQLRQLVSANSKQYRGMRTTIVYHSVAQSYLVSEFLLRICRWRGPFKGQKWTASQANPIHYLDGSALASNDEIESEIPHVPRHSRHRGLDFLTTTLIADSSHKHPPASSKLKCRVVYLTEEMLSLGLDHRYVHNFGPVIELVSELSI